MFEEVILHIGAHKTGSSAIQQSLVGYDDGETLYAALNASGNHSTMIAMAYRTDLGDFHHVLKNGIGPQEVARERREARAAIRAQLETAGRKRLIFSGEGISMLDEAGAHAFIDSIRPYSRRIRAICYVRDPISHAASAFQQRAKEVQASLPGTQSPEYRFRLEKFVAALGRDNVTVRKFDRAALKGQSVVQDFCDVAGLDMARVEDQNANESISLDALRVLYHFNRTNPQYIGDRILYRARQRLRRVVVRAYAGGPPIDKARFEPLADLSDLPYLEQQFGIRFDMPPPSPDASRDALEAWLHDLSAVPTGPLEQRLAGFGIEGDFNGHTALVNRLYYHLVHLAYVTAGQKAPGRPLRPAKDE